MKSGDTMKSTLQKSKKSTGKIVLIVIVVLVAMLSVAFVWYVNDYYHAVDVDAYLSSTDTVQVIQVDDGIWFCGGNEVALIFYPGAKVEYTAYAPLMMSLAENGVDCFLVEMPFNLAFFGMNKAETIMSEYVSYEAWYIGGHSLGGAMAASFASNHLDELDGLILFASYSTSDLGDLTTLSIYGSEDGVLNMDSLEAGRDYSTDYTEIVIDGGNHAGFGSYGEQAGDGEASISQEEQWELTVAEILGWLAD
ncbi:MAG: alpha/beta hydrolase [Oscillospiraceae bacterium]|nr:alpha/beta hydrolase [Oscillospiraceae bacterium]